MRKIHRAVNGDGKWQFITKETVQFGALSGDVRRQVWSIAQSAAVNFTILSSFLITSLLTTEPPYHVDKNCLEPAHWIVSLASRLLYYRSVLVSPLSRPPTSVTRRLRRIRHCSRIGNQPLPSSLSIMCTFVQTITVSMKTQKRRNAHAVNHIQIARVQ